MTSLRSVLYVGHLADYMQAGIISSCMSRCEGLRMLGLRVDGFDCTGFRGVSSWAQRLNHRFYCGSSVRQLNRDLVDAVRAKRPDVLWVDKGYWIYPRALAEIRQYSRFLVHYNTDDIFGPGSYSWLHRKGMRHYDLCLSTNRDNVLEIRKRYGIRTMRAGMGFDANAHSPVRSNRRGSGGSAAAIVFIGHWEPHSEGFIAALHRAGHRVGVWGAGWRRARNPEFRTVSLLPGAAYVSILSMADIALCFLSRVNRNESTGRSFEIPAIGTFLMAERTPEHEYFYGDGIGAALFSTSEELIEKVDYYLEHPAERDRIASTGHARCMAMRLSWQDHMRREWPLVEDLLLSDRQQITDERADQPFWPGFRQGRVAINTGSSARPNTQPMTVG